MTIGYILTDICRKNAFIVLHSLSTNPFMNSIKLSLPPNLKSKIAYRYCCIFLEIIPEDRSTAIK